MAEKIRLENGRLLIPDQPIIPYIEGDGVGQDIWSEAQKVIDVAIEKAYQNLYALGIHPISSLFDTSDVPSVLCTKSHDEEHS